MKKVDPLDRSLDGKEREMERINVKLLANKIKTLLNQKEANRTTIEELEIKNEQADLVIKKFQEDIEKKKKLIGGAKIRDVFPETGKEEQPVGDPNGKGNGSGS